MIIVNKKITSNKNVDRYGSDEEQTRTTITETGENYVIQTEFCNKVKERKMRNKITWFALSKATSTGGKNRKLFITNAIYKWKLLFKNIRHPCLI